jgi:hypothetical protein
LLWSEEEKEGGRGEGETEVRKGGDGSAGESVVVWVK